MRSHLAGSPSPLRGGSGRGYEVDPEAGRPTGLDLLRQAVERLRAETSERPPGTVVDSELAELHWVIEAQRAQFTVQLRDFDRSGGYAASGALSAAGWLRMECRLSPATASEQVRVARALPELSETAE